MKAIKAAFFVSVLCCAGCISLSQAEREELAGLSERGISLDTPPSGFVAPTFPKRAGALNAVLGIGNFYLAETEGASPSLHYSLGIGNLLLWPVSVCWAIPEGYCDARTQNERALLDYCRRNPQARACAKARKEEPASSPSIVSHSAREDAVKCPKYVIVGSSYDGSTRQGRLEVDLQGQDYRKAMEGIIEDIQRICATKNIVIRDGESLPDGSSFKITDEARKGNHLLISFQAIE